MVGDNPIARMVPFHWDNQRLSVFHGLFPPSLDSGSRGLLCPFLLYLCPPLSVVVLDIPGFSLPLQFLHCIPNFSLIIIWWVYSVLFGSVGVLHSMAHWLSSGGFVLSSSSGLVEVSRSLVHWSSSGGFVFKSLSGLVGTSCSSTCSSSLLGSGLGCPCFVLTSGLLLRNLRTRAPYTLMCWWEFLCPLLWVWLSLLVTSGRALPWSLSELSLVELVMLMIFRRSPWLLIRPFPLYLLG